MSTVSTTRACVSRWLLGTCLAASLLPVMAMALTTVDTRPARSDTAERALALGQVQERVAPVPLLRGEFEQEKWVQGFRNPLRSAGRFLIARSHGVVWTTLKPFPSEVVLTRDRILNRTADGSVRVEVDARQQPGLRQVNAVMFALMSGDAQALSTHFDAQPELRQDSTWRLVLTPRPGALARIFDKITLEGDRYVREVEIFEHGGDRTRLHFFAMSQAPEQLTVDEARSFE